MDKRPPSNPPAIVACPPPRRLARGCDNPQDCPFAGCTFHPIFFSSAPNDKPGASLDNEASLPGPGPPVLAMSDRYHHARTRNECFAPFKTYSLCFIQAAWSTRKGITSTQAPSNIVLGCPSCTCQRNCSRCSSLPNLSTAESLAWPSYLRIQWQELHNHCIDPAQVAAPASSFTYSQIPAQPTSYTCPAGSGTSSHSCACGFICCPKLPCQLVAGPSSLSPIVGATASIPINRCLVAVDSDRNDPLRTYEWPLP